MPAALGPCSRLGIQSAQGIRRGSCAAFTPAAFTHRYDSFRSQRAGRVRRGCRITGIAAVRPGRASPNRTPSVRLSPMQTASARTCMQPAPALSMNGAVPYCRYRRRTDMRSSATDTPAARGHELSEGRYIGMGWLDRRDLMRWISLIVQADPHARIVLHGVSMGATEVMMTTGQRVRGDRGLRFRVSVGSVRRQRGADVSPAAAVDGDARAGRHEPVLPAEGRLRVPAGLQRGTARACHRADAVHPRHG